jgi:GntR family transcriptional regulator, trigonelline degradation regulator
MPATTGSLRVVPNTLSLRERVTQVLREAILNLHFEPGEKLVERRLCEETGVSRTCVREALRHLEAEGLVKATPTRGMYVSKIEPDEARQIYEVRKVLESAMTRQFVERASDKQVATLAAAFNKVEVLSTGKDYLAYARALERFSACLMEGAGNDVAKQILDMLSARITYLRTITARAARGQRDSEVLLRKVLTAIQERNAELAEECSRAFVQHSSDFALDLLRATKEFPGRQESLGR